MGEPIAVFPGRSFRIIVVSSFNKKELKRHLSGIIFLSYIRFAFVFSQYTILDKYCLLKHKNNQLEFIDVYKRQIQSGVRGGKHENEKLFDVNCMCLHVLFDTWDSGHYSEPE